MISTPFLAAKRQSRQKMPMETSKQQPPMISRSPRLLRTLLIFHETIPLVGSFSLQTASRVEWLFLHSHLPHLTSPFLTNPANLPSTFRLSKHSSRLHHILVNTRS